jgi:hypothetical protein
MTKSLDLFSVRNFHRGKLSSVILPFAFFGFLLAFSPQSAFSCGNRFRIYEVSTTRGALVDLDDRPIPNARLVIRDASLNASGPESCCGARRGPVVKRIKTDKRGFFDLRGLKIGTYWVTYMDPKEGESFIVDVKELNKGERFELGINHWIGSLCMTVDIERNATKPPGLLFNPSETIYVTAPTRTSGH